MKMQVLSLFAASLLAAGCACNQSLDLDIYKEDAPVTGAAAVQGKNDVKKSPYFRHFDFFSKKPTRSLIILPKFKTMQQTTEFTSGPSTVKMVLDYLGRGKDVTERGLAKEMDVRDDRNPRSDGSFGATTEAIAKALQSRGIETETGSFFDDEVAFADFLKEELKAGNPVLVCYNAWGAQWVVVIGYDDLDTPNTGDDVVILADAYDIGDHQQDGYFVEPLSRMFWSWYDPCFMYGEVAVEQYVVAKRPTK